MGVLVVSEKDSVAAAIARYLGRGYRRFRVVGVPAYRFRRGDDEWLSMGLRGHLMDFDFGGELASWRRTEPERLFDAQPILVYRPESTRHVLALRSLAKSAELVYLALDADSEGEAIAYEAMMTIMPVNPRVRFLRVRFNAVTRDDILEAFNKPQQLDLRTVEKVFTRMMLDLTIGAAFTRLLTLSVRRAAGRANGIVSYGPCQTPVLSLVVRRALERENFVPRKYYVVSALVAVDGHRLAVRSERFEGREDAVAAAKSIRGSVGRVVEASFVEARKSPPVPLETVELEKRASKWLGIRSREALALAEELYRHGLISYPRTETNVYPQTLDLRRLVAELARSPFGWYAGRLLASRLSPTRGRSDDGAHPPIYPVRAADLPDVVRALGRHARKAWKIYELVVRHFLATLSPPAVYERQRVVVRVGGLDLVAEGRRTISEGYWEIYPYERIEDSPIPRVEAGATVRVVEVEVEERETKPPDYLSEAELLALMKRHGIGTDATMQEHIHTNVRRGYMNIVRGRCIPSPLGKALILGLNDTAPHLADPDVRSRMESMLAQISRGRADPRDVLEAVKREFRGYYKLLLDRLPSLSKSIAGSLDGGSPR